jgi:hypothetical protein
MRVITRIEEHRKLKNEEVPIGESAQLIEIGREFGLRRCDSR